MRLVLILVLMFTVPIVVIACGGSAPPLYGPQSCVDEHKQNTGLIAYLPANANAAVCMPPEAAVYITCVRELSQSNFASTNSKNTSVTLPAISFDGVNIGQVANAVASTIRAATSDGGASDGGGAGGNAPPGVNTASTASVTIAYSEDGRKAAFDYCKEVAISALKAEIARVQSLDAGPGQVNALESRLKAIQ